MTLRRLAISFFAAIICCLPAMTRLAHAIEMETALQGAVSILPSGDRDLEVNLGLGLFQRPEFLGAEDYKTSLLPLIDIEYRGRLFASTQRGLGLFLFDTGNFRAGPRITFDEGRDSSDYDLTRNLADIDPSAEVGLYFESYLGWLRLKGDIRKGVGGGHQGALARLDMATAIRAGARDTLFLGVNVTAADQSYMEAYFGVPTARATPQVPAFSAKAGPRDANVYASFVHSFQGGMYLSIDGGAGRLLGDAETSPIAGTLDQVLTQFYLGTVIGYRF
ncbi:MAG TPA: hypothetical protein DCF61_04065 [Alphaproteobacteria bacterium]|nr:hypothetical protein [Alphaproteobacteria bacterium]HCO91581.1 hypothetical protein [Alphaproteobacteria bacterium]